MTSLRPHLPLHHSHLRVGLLALIVLFGIASPTAQAVTTSPRILTANGQMELVRLTPDSRRAVYTVAAFNGAQADLASIPLAGGTPVTLNTAPASTGVRDFQLSRDSSWVVFSLAHAVYSVPVAGGTPTQLLPLGAGPWTLSVVGITPDSARVILAATPTATPTQTSLYSIPIAGGTAVRLHAPLVAGQSVAAVVIGGPGSRVVYTLADSSAGPQTTILVSAPFAGGTPTTLDGPIADDFSSITVTPDGQSVVYTRTADGTSGGPRLLHTVPIAGGTPTSLATPPAGLASDSALTLTPDGARAVFFIGSPKVLYSTPLTGGGSFVRLSPALDPNSTAWLFTISPNSARVAFLIDTGPFTARELYSVPVAGGTAVKLNEPFALGGPSVDDRFVFSRDSARVAYLASTEVEEDRKARLFSVLADGSAAPVRLADPPAQFALYPELHVTADNRWLIYGAEREAVSAVIADLYATPLDGAFAPVRLTSDTTVAVWPISGGIGRFLETADSRQVVFRRPANVPFGLGPQALAVADLVVPGHTVERITPQGGTLSTANGQVTVQAPAGVVGSDVTFEHTPLGAPGSPPPTGRTALNAFTLEARDGGGQPVTQFGAPLTITVSYTEGELAIAGLDESSLNLAFWNGSAWVELLPCAGCGVDTAANRITVVLDHFTEFALLGSAPAENPSVPRMYLPLTGRE